MGKREYHLSYMKNSEENLNTNNIHNENYIKFNTNLEKLLLISLHL